MKKKVWRVIRSRATRSSPRAVLKLESAQDMLDLKEGGLSLQEIGEMYGICGSWACQIILWRKRRNTEAPKP